MEISNITRHLQVPLPPDQAYTKFVYEINEWWPKAYTWSGEKLLNIRIHPAVNGLCTETGPYEFRCDWGRVIYITEGESIAFLWQIGPDRIPEPDPDKASEVFLHFFKESDQKTRIDFGHRHFHRHGQKGGLYREMMNSPEGWDAILEHFIQYCKV
ncbi:ATPase [Chitinophaga qingshengii]|uniref:ATPase n=1 Tax=Chitinophaga qingshengii TaxID=1569794 RepID=A0ABR7TX67_9BACT|nr:ATPase [Chitinophaga qingshengii]MBC9935062.1 ATPase [Chitinophaga qingshengii]